MTVEQLAQRLVQFESTQENSEAMHACLDFCVAFFDGLSVTVHRYEHEGIPSVVIQTKDTTDVDVLLLGHIDTVEGDPSLFEGNIKDGKLYGRGTLDMKAFVATSMAVMRELLEEGFEGNIALAIVTDEELGGTHGARHLVEDVGYHAQVVLVPDDGEDINRIINETKHIFQVRFESEGKEAHANRPWRGDNAIEKLLHTYQKLRAHFGDLSTEPEDLWINTISLGTIGGGTATNEIPKEAWMTVDVRMADGTSRAEVEALIKETLAPGVTYAITLEGYPTNLSKDDPALQRYVSEVERVTGKEVAFGRSGGGTDGRYFAAAGMKVIVHQGNGGNCQTDEEYVETRSLADLVQIQKAFIKKEFAA